VLFLDADWKSAAMPARAHCLRQTKATGLPAFVYLKWVNNGSDWLPPGKAAVRIGLRREVFSDRKRRVFGMSLTKAITFTD
jgi:hypothetical protein